MKFLTEGDYHFTGGVLHVPAEHDDRRYLVAIDRQVFEAQYNATATGDFHEYWTHVLNNRAELESVALDKLEADGPQGGDTISIGTGDFV